jgi:hypothetical protein
VEETVAFCFDVVIKDVPELSGCLEGTECDLHKNIL